MPTDMQKLMENKESIVNSIQTRGPSLPVQIAREANLNLLFASAYLSELYNERRIKMSSMKVGSSSLYYIEGQEAQLENFIQYLNGKEKEAFSLLKSQKLLEDDKMNPAIRVALRGLKDFAVPLRIKVNEDSKLFWKHFLISDTEIKEIAQSLFGKKEKKAKDELAESEKQKTLVSQPSEPLVLAQEIKLEKPKVEEKKAESLVKQEEKSEIPNTILEKPKKAEKKKKQVEESKFIKNIKEYLISKDIELLDIRDEKKKDFLARVRIDTLFGKQEYLLIAKEKKKVTEEDITLALHKAQLEKMPALFMAPGDIDKKALYHAKLWKNLVKFEKVKF